MKTVIIGDVHGRSIWELILSLEEDFDMVIFLGDYFDSFDVPYTKQMSNFREILNMKRISNKEIILLIGNHDGLGGHYGRWATSSGEIYSGFQSPHFLDIQKEFEDNEEMFQMAYKLDNYLFSHAGVTKDFLDRFDLNWDNCVEGLNDLLKYKPQSFAFVGTDPYGHDPRNGPTWVRPDILYYSSKDSGLIQIVGHTPQNTIHFEDNKHYFVDTQSSHKKEYLIIEEGELKLRCIN